MNFNSKPQNDDFPVGADMAELLQPFADGFPEIAGRFIKELPNSAAYSRLEQVLLEAIRHKLTEKDQQAQTALHDVQRKLFESQREVAQLAEAIEKKEAFLNRLRTDKDAEIQSLTETIRAQNSILARQQKKLQRLLGAMEQESEA